MFPGRSKVIPGVLVVLVVVALSCNLPSATPVDEVPATEGSETPSGAAPASGGMQVRFSNLSDGGSVDATTGADGRPLVDIEVEVTGAAPMIVSLKANGLPAVDVGGHVLEAMNSAGTVPFTAQIPWSPPNGGGEYTLVASAMDDNKQLAEATIHITVTGIAAFTPLPPPMTREEAAIKVEELIRADYGVDIPAASLQRFDFPTNPTRSRWIGAAYYKGMRHYVQVFDDGHAEWSNGPYADPAHRSLSDTYYYCRPSGTYRVLVVFVDYGNLGDVKAEALADVPVVVEWLNGLYENFAAGQGFTSALMHVEADAAYVASPPAPGELLTAEQVRTRAGKDPTAYDFVMQIDLDVNGSYGQRYFADILEPGGGIALQGCGASKFGPINIWSSVPDAGSIQGALVMDFNHELSHLFGMMDDWPFQQGIPGPRGSSIDDWIPYTMFGWTDTDGDGIAEIIDPTPYDTSGPLP
jgi:hypothetical protein